MWARISILDLFSRLGFISASESWEYEAERVSKVIVGDKVEDWIEVIQLPGCCRWKGR
jgi:hypothetical protein